ncbi:MAG: LytTR family DNA-binding domain-containing protein [Oscillospiraceae bacterium]
MNIAICDDMEDDSLSLRSAILEWLDARNQAARLRTYVCGEDLLADLEDDYVKFDLIFLDIYMDGITGMETAKRLRAMEIKAPLIFLTTSPDFAVEGYRVSATGYLLKPLNKQELGELLNKLVDLPRQRQLAIKCAKGHHYFDYRELCYIESQGNYLFLHTANGEAPRIAQKLDELETLLNDCRFLRCHKSYLVNMDYIRKVDDNFILQNGSVVPIRVRSRKSITEAYYSYFLKHAIV